ncbi:TetR/AcrR family transcriptional regulator [Sphingomonas sp. MMS24-J13]|uniref:TetR/AcrR family transcriptional regulator n=1 Tax=Sphingomonas sp. MMS24-J13 TaxID=3238686 RepID=UPI00384E95A7
MAKSKPAPAAGEKRKKGRPATAAAGVGREAVLAAATRLLQVLPPNQVTIIAIAREAGADPAMIRYYFGNREALLLAAVKRLTELGDPMPGIDRPLDALQDYIKRTFRFTRSAKYMQRLMIEELDSARSPELLDQVREWNWAPVEFYEDIAKSDGGKELAPFDALFLHLAVIGISDFFVSGAPLVRLLAPPGTDMAELDRKYETFVTQLLLNGLRKR